MARYTGPKTKISRRYGVLLGGSPRAFENKSYPPGMHGPKGARRKISEYATALAEKQKLRFQYGILERQFRRYFETASRRRGVTGLILLQLLETRLDNVVYRMGFSKTRAGARQLVSHGHVLLNDRKTDISSATLKVGDTVSIRIKANSRQLVQRGLDQTQIVEPPAWLLVDKENMTGKVMSIPTREEINPLVNEQLVVELYSR
ncbi:MAG: 30S ribosomal protein S4 [Verrucomicrobia bacterium]|jgi:small subunit ribosomal protein S4|nr:MAG: 30S ribosomal protein S4 [Verrucomicrobiota bacterium]MDH4470360.1 30S ribosomal protein S4 [Verrucomicrobiae bacterium]